MIMYIGQFGTKRPETKVVLYISDYYNSIRFLWRNNTNIITEKQIPKIYNKIK